MYYTTEVLPNWITAEEPPDQRKLEAAEDRLEVQSC